MDKSPFVQNLLLLVIYTGYELYVLDVYAVEGKDLVPLVARWIENLVTKLFEYDSLN